MSWSVKSYPVYEEVHHRNVDRCSLKEGQVLLNDFKQF